MSEITKHTEHTKADRDPITWMLAAALGAIVLCLFAVLWVIVKAVDAIAGAVAAAEEACE